MNGWVRAKDRLPEKSGLYLVAYPSKWVSTELFSECLSEIPNSDFEHDESFRHPGFYDWDHETGENYEITYRITYWMPIPELPEEGKV